MSSATWASATSMNKTRLPGLALLLALLSAATVARADCDFDDFPLAPGMTTSRVSDSMQWNNLPMNVHLFRSELPLERVLGFYEQVWEDSVDTSTFGPWQQVTHIDEDCMLMVQVQGDANQSHGRLMLVNPPDAKAMQQPLGEGVPIPPDAAVVSDLKSQDRFRDGRLVMLASADTLEESVNWYLGELPRSGWTLERHTSQQNDATLIYSKGQEQLSVVFLRHGEFTQILLNRMDR